jgi:alkylation response protein AidB-like acyl-CoA dehydrogenase
MTPEPDRLRAQVRELAERWRVSGRYRPACDAWLRGYDPQFSAELGRQGWIGITWPREAGGSARSHTARLVITEELLRAGAPVAAHWIADRQIGPAILRYGTRELRQEFLPRIAAAEVTFCLGMSEPDAGSDLAAVRTTARRDGGGWRIRGRKIWTSHAHRASHAYVLARTDGTGGKHEGLTEFVVDMGSEGVSVSPIVDLAGEHHFNEVVFDDVYVPERWVIGTVGDGWRQVTSQLAYERGGPERVLSTYPLLVALLEDGRRRDDEGALAEIGRLVARLAGLRRMCWDIARAMDEGRAPVREAATLKYLGTEFERDVTETARDLVGTPPAPDGTEVWRLLAEATLAGPGFTIRGGSSEVLLSIIAKQEGRAEGRTVNDGALLAGAVDDVLGSAGEDAGRDLPPVWDTVLEAGWPFVGVPEELGGSGGTAGDLVTIIARAARHPVRIPLVETALAAWVLARAGRADLLDGLRVAAVAVPDVPAPWAHAADLLVWCGPDGTALLDPRADTVTIERSTNIAGEPRDHVHVQAVDATPLPEAPGATEIRARAGLLRAAACVGAAAAALDLTRRHVTVREQFGRPLARIPAVASAVAVMAGEIGQAAAALDRAVRVHDGGGDTSAATAAARVCAGRAATTVARLSHQVHGAIGITREYPLHIHTRRLWAWRDEDGAEHLWAVALGTAAAGGTEQQLWDVLTAVPAAPDPNI